AASGQPNLWVARHRSETGPHGRARTRGVAQVSCRLYQPRDRARLVGTHSRMARRKGADGPRNARGKGCPLILAPCVWVASRVRTKAMNCKTTDLRSGAPEPCG